MDLEIRSAQAGDLDRLIDLYRHLHPAEASLPDGPARNRLWTVMLARPGFSCIVGSHDDVLATACCLAIIPNLTRGGRPYALIENVVTHADFRRRGFGKAVVMHALDLAWKEGCYKVMLLTGSKRSETHRFYEACGFRSDEKVGFVARPSARDQHAMSSALDSGRLALAHAVLASDADVRLVVNHAPWVDWAQRLEAIAQTGLAYTKDPYDLERYQQLRELASTIVSAHTGLPEEAIRADFALQRGYPTPKVDVRAVVFQNGRILLVRERGLGLWSLPGGWADVGQSLGEVAARETLEETGYRVRPVKLLAVFDKARHPHPPSFDYVYKCFVACQLEGGEASVSHETDAVEFFDATSLPSLDARRVTSSQVARMFEHLADPDLPTDFD